MSQYIKNLTFHGLPAFLLTFEFDLVNEIETKCQHQTIPELQQGRHSLSSLRGSEDIEILQIFFAR